MATWTTQTPQSLAPEFTTCTKWEALMNTKKLQAIYGKNKGMIYEY